MRGSTSQLNWRRSIFAFGCQTLITIPNTRFCTRLPISLLLLLGVCTFCTGCRDEDQFPSRPITLICPWSPGGGTDRVSRQVAALLEDELQIPVNVINATGGSGVTGHTRGSLAKPDGHTLTMITVELNMLHWRGLTNVSYHDFEPLMLLNRDDAAVFVAADSPWKSLAELEHDIRARPRGLKASGTAQGGIWHISVAGWLEAVGMNPDDVVWVSINGAGPSLQELLSGGVDFICCSLPEASTLVDAGQIRCLGVMAPKRVENFPNVRTFHEQGVNWKMWGWRGLALPSGVPTERKEKLLAAIERVIARDDYRQFMRNSGFDARSAGPKEFAAELARLDQGFGDIFKRDAYRGVRDSRYGPMVFPMVIGGLLVFVLVLLFWTRGQTHRETLLESAVEALDEEASEHDPGSPTAAPTAAGPASRHGAIVPVVLAVAGVIVLVAVVDWLGFVLTAFLLMTFFMKYLGTRLPVAVAASALYVVVIYQFFAVHMRVSLPWGLFGW
ncbi:MAG: tripartite tricarboxylate transporter substrate-binding protein [Pirellulales bacterium]